MKQRTARKSEYMEQEKVKEMLCKGEERRSIQMYRSQLLRSEGEERRGEGNKEEARSGSA